MSDSPFALLHGERNWGEDPWFQYDCTVATEVSHDALQLICNTLGPRGDFHDQHGWLVHMDSWAALRMYVQACVDNNEQFEFDLNKVAEDDAFYVALASARMEAFLAKVNAAK